MKLKILLLALLFPCTGMATAQDSPSVILTYQRNFVRSSLTTKLELIKEAGKVTVGQDLGPLYDTAMRFVLDNAALLAGDSQLRDLALLAVKKAGESAWPKGAPDIWSVFQIYPGDIEVRAAAVAAYAKAGSGIPKTVTDLVVFSQAQLAQYRSGGTPEYAALEAAVEALGTMKDTGAWPVLFSAAVAAPNPAIATKSVASMVAIRGDLRTWLEDALAKGTPVEKAAALDIGLAGSALGADDRGRLSEAALSAGLAWAGEASADLVSIHALRAKATSMIRELRWQKAAPLAIRNFRILLAEYNDGKGAASELLDAVSCLGVMGSTDAAQALALQLQLINAQTEASKPFDEALLLGVIDALGNLGDKVAFDYLLYVGYLRYPESVKNAARAALQKLKW
ncbi:MAG: hypothetical protein WCQ50_10670 [Spirochaetota bacterium]